MCPGTRSTSDRSAAVGGPAQRAGGGPVLAEALEGVQTRGVEEVGAGEQHASPPGPPPRAGDGGQADGTVPRAPLLRLQPPGHHQVTPAPFRP